MGVSTNMDGDKKSGTNNCKLKLEGQSFQNAGTDQHCSHDGPHAPHSPCQGLPHLLASASSPSLLTGCGDPTTPTGASIEQHIFAHHVHVSDAPAVLQSIEASTQRPYPSLPLSASLSEGDPPDSFFLTPSQTRFRHPQGRPVSAPPHHLERISGVLLRLVGDHYMCTTCGRQLRNIGDELTLETSIRRILSSDEINRISNR